MALPGICQRHSSCAADPVRAAECGRGPEEVRLLSRPPGRAILKLHGEPEAENGMNASLEDVLAIVREVTERIPFNRVLGLAIESLEPERAAVRLTMRDELVGNFMRGSLHGGAISTTLDYVGGLVAFLGVVKKLPGRSFEAMAERFAKIGTIDLRVDYLRPGLGQHFIATGYVLRTGSKVAVTRMEMHNDEGQLIAVGTGAYVVA
jgi:uncharacterized protein (TIGR00369 family)